MIVRLVLLVLLLILFSAGCMIVIPPATSPTYAPYPTYTPYPTLSPQSTPTSVVPTPTRDPELVDQWAVYTAPANDVNVILLNGHIVAAMYCCHEEPSWTDISGQLRHDPHDDLTFVNLNGPGSGEWGFQMWHNGEVVWKSAGFNQEMNSLGNVNTIRIDPNNTWDHVTPPVSVPHFSDQWRVRLSAEDVGLILVNNIPVAGSYSGGATAPESPTPGLVDSDWIDISHLLRSDQNNTISVVVWNRAGPYHWQAFVSRGDEVMWQRNGNGQDQTGEVFSTSLMITEAGEVIPTQKD